MNLKDMTVMQLTRTGNELFTAISSNRLNEEDEWKSLRDLVEVREELSARPTFPSNAARMWLQRK